MIGDCPVVRKFREWLCRIGLHRWSRSRGGIKICRRDGCDRARTYGLSGLMRQYQWEQDLYSEFVEIEDGDRDE